MDKTVRDVLDYCGYVRRPDRLSGEWWRMVDDEGEMWFANHSTLIRPHRPYRLTPPSGWRDAVRLKRADSVVAVLVAWHLS